MDEITKGLLIGGAFSLLTPLIPAVFNFLSQRSNNKKSGAEGDSINTDTIRRLMSDVQKLSEDMLIVKSSNRALWSYVYELLDFIKDKGLIPPQPPSELDTNPRLKKLLETQKNTL